MEKQEDRLDYLVRVFRDDLERYSGIDIPTDKDGKVTMLRSLMNVRMPGELAQEALKIQDEYLKERAREKGVVELADIPTVRDAKGNEENNEGCGVLISVWQGDITRIACDAIVNAANSQMLGCFVPMHTCIDNCIHTYAGIELRFECNQKMNELRKRYGSDYEQPTSIPMLTDAYNLPAKKVIHVVGPIVYGRLTAKEEDELRDCYSNVLDMCEENGLRSVAFCCISTGVFHFPNDRAAAIAVDTVERWIVEHEGSMDRVIFNVFKDEDKYLYDKILEKF